MKLILKLLILSGLAVCMSCNHPENKKHTPTADTLVSLSNEHSSVSFSLFGGALVSFKLKAENTNPYTWKIAPTDMPENNKKGAPFQGHFLCLGRWGGPTPGEVKMGMPHNGEASNNWWEMQEKTKNHTVITCNAPLEGIKLTRKISLAPHNAIFTVTETFTNQLPVLRNIPIVQHATIGVPFLDSAMVVQTNATYGFNQKFVPASYLKYESKWPYVVNDSTGKTIDAGKTNYPEGFVATYVFSDTIGWITAYNPKLRLLLGYAFKTSQYPWLHIWHGVKDGKLWAKGLEFGTTGLGDTSPLEDRFVLNFHGHSNLNYIDANSSQNKSYLCFLIKFDEDIKEIKNISYTNKFLTFTYETIDKSRIQKLWME